MATLSLSTVSLLLPLYLLAHAITSSATGDSVPSTEFPDDVPPANRSSFPPGFLFGSASAAYQVEGAYNESGKGPSNWDVYTATYPEKIADGSNGNVAIDAYHRYKEDVAIMNSLGFNSYRFSISWARILPNGNASEPPNEEGVAHYNNLINELLSKGITPFVTIFHFDVPQTLEKEYMGFLNRTIVDDFVGYADICFKLFGDRVKHWVIINEPLTMSLYGYAQGTLAPGRCSSWMDLNCTGGNSATEPYIVGHHLLLSHGATVKLYREKYQATQKGMVGTAQVIQWLLPLNDTKKDHDAKKRRLDFTLGWFQEPLLTGDYPRAMRTNVGPRLPKFTKEESAMLKGACDFVGLNYYTSYYVFNAPPSNTLVSAMTDSQTNFSPEKDGIPIGPKAGISWEYVYPKGIRDGVLYAHNKFKLPIYITENGLGDINNETLTIEQALNDTLRVFYYREHLAYLQSAIKDGAIVKGYFAWSVMDNFEWAEGYTIRFGINFVDYKNGLKRYAKLSAIWIRNFLKN